MSFLLRRYQQHRGPWQPVTVKGRHTRTTSAAAQPLNRAVLPNESWGAAATAPRVVAPPQPPQSRVGAEKETTFLIIPFLLFTMVGETATRGLVDEETPEPPAPQQRYRAEPSFLLDVEVLQGINETHTLVPTIVADLFPLDANIAKLLNMSFL